MNSHTASLSNAIILITIGGWGYFESGSPTSLIPVVIGIILVLLNRGVKSQNKIIAHIAVLVTMLGFALIMPLMRAIEDGRTDAILRILIMLSSSVFAMIFFIKSFVEARKK